MQGISVCWFYILQLYYIHWLALVISWWHLRVFYVEDHVISTQWEFYVFFSNLDFFYFLLWLPWLEHFKLCWIIVAWMGTLVLFLNLEEMLSVFHCWEYVCCRFIINGLYYIEIGSFYAYFLEFLFFIINGYWILLKDFSASVEIIIWFLPISLLIWCITFLDLHILKNSCTPGINTTWS